MNARKRVTLDGNEAVANIAYRLNEVMAIYPITPSSTMAELCDQWSAEGRLNLWGTVPSVVQYQSEGGAVGDILRLAPAHPHDPVINDKRREREKGNQRERHVDEHRPAFAWL